MIKRNDGYALVYVLVVLLVLVALSMAVTTISLHNLKSQRSSIDRMTEKYEAQGLVEQVVAQFESATDKAKVDAISNSYPQTGSEGTENEAITMMCDEDSETNEVQYEITAKSGNTIVTACIKLIEIPKPESGDENIETQNEGTNGEEPPAGESPEDPMPEIIGHKVIYLSYSTEVTS